MTTGLAFPEFMVHRLVTETLDTLFADTRLLDATLEGLPDEDRDSIRTALERRERRVRLGWSQEPIEDWLITVALAGTAKGNSGRGTLGDIASRPTEYAIHGDELAAQVDATTGAAITLTGGIPSAPGDVEPKGLVRLRTSEEVYEYATYDITAGVCTLTNRGICNTTPRAWNAGAEVIFFEWEQRDGWPEDVTLRLDIGATNPVFVMAIARIVQAFLMRGAATGEFDAAGFTLQDCNATDLAPRPPIWPAPFFNRTLTVRFLTALSLPAAYQGIVDTPVELTTE